MMNVRNDDMTREHARRIAISEDGGMSWNCLGADNTLISPACEGSFIRYSWSDD